MHLSLHQVAPQCHAFHLVANRFNISETERQHLLGRALASPMHHKRSTVKSVFLLAYLFDIPICMVESQLSANQAELSSANHNM